MASDTLVMNMASIEAVNFRAFLDFSDKTRVIEREQREPKVSFGILGLTEAGAQLCALVRKPANPVYLRDVAARIASKGITVTCYTIQGRIAGGVTLGVPLFTETKA